MKRAGGRHLLKFIQYWIHERGMEGVRDDQFTGLDALLVEPVQYFLHGSGAPEMTILSGPLMAAIETKGR